MEDPFVLRAKPGDAAAIAVLVGELLQEIMRGIERSHIVIIFVTPNYERKWADLASTVDWIRTEADHAFHHHGPGRIDRHHHLLALLHPGGASRGLADRRIVGKRPAAAEHRLQQRPHRWPVGRLVGADLYW